LVRIPLAATRLVPFTLPLLLYGDTPRPSQFENREHAIGNRIDRVLDQELKEFYEGLGISIEGELIRVHRGENITFTTYKIPDARVGDIFFVISVSEGRPSNDQVVGYFDTQARPRYVLIVRPQQRGRSYIITPPRDRYARD
jgi:hypothetical protein